jgi:hypothetical protein
MNAPIQIHPDRFRNFGAPDGAHFVLVTEPRIVGTFDVVHSPGYASVRTLPCSDAEPFEAMLAEMIPEPAHVLVILPNRYFLSPSPDALGPRRKLAVMACFSTPSSLESIRHFVKMAEATEPEAQNALAEHFFKYAETSSALMFRDRNTGTEASFAHLNQGLQWHEQLGTLAWGEQQLLPSGEISVLPVSVFGQDINERLDVSGEITFRGEPILHCGSVSYLPSDQARIYEQLCALRRGDVVARVERGMIEALSTREENTRPAVEMLEKMFAIDSRYRTLLEIGLGVNTQLNLFPGNTAMNEVYGGQRGAVHFGLGLLPFTQYHLDIICPGTSVHDARGERIFGGTVSEARA